MIGVEIYLPIAFWRKPFSRGEGEDFPPPSTGYGFFLSMIGEYDKTKYEGAKILPVMVGQPYKNQILRKNSYPTSATESNVVKYNILTNVRVVLWLEHPLLEEKVKDALIHGSNRQGSLSLGESKHMVRDLDLFNGDSERMGRYLFKSDKGRYSACVWHDRGSPHYGQFQQGNVEERPLLAPTVEEMFVISAE